MNVHIPLWLIRGSVVVTVGACGFFVALGLIALAMTFSWRVAVSGMSWIKVYGEFRVFMMRRNEERAKAKGGSQ